jgi:hypothetical protein
MYEVQCARNHHLQPVAVTGMLSSALATCNGNFDDTMILNDLMRKTAPAGSLYNTFSTKLPPWELICYHPINFLLNPVELGKEWSCDICKYLDG